jgi:thiol:disulfide interchange protein DsbD
VLPPLANMLAWSLLLFGAATLLRRWRVAAVVPVVAGIALLVGALAGSRDPLRPLAVFTHGTPVSAPVAWKRVASLEELQERLKAPGKPVMLDFYADWCVSCKEMESFTFSDPKVRAQLDQMLLLQVDVTANSENDKALLKRFYLFGPPGIIFFDAQGREIKGLRVIGYQNAERFLKTLSLVEGK